MRKDNRIVLGVGTIIAIVTLASSNSAYAQRINTADERFLVLIEDYKAKIRELLDKVSQLQEKQARLTQENNELRKESDRLKKMSQEERTQFSALDESHNQLIQAKLNLEKQVQDLNIQLSQAAEQKDNQIKQYQEEVNQLKQSKETTSGQSKDLIQQNSWLKDQYVKDRQVVGELKEQLAAALKDKDALENSLKQNEKVVAGLRLERETLFKQVGDAGQELKEYQAKLQNKEEIERRKQESEQRLSQLQDKNVQLDERYSKSLSDLKAAQDKVKTLSLQVMQLQAANDNLFKENNELKEIRTKRETASGRLSDLIQLNKKLLKETATLHYNLGVFYAQAQKYDKAIVEFEKVLHINPNDNEAHYNLGVIFAEYRMDEDRALSHFRKFLNLSPNDDASDRARRYIASHEAYTDKMVKP